MKQQRKNTMILSAFILNYITSCANYAAADPSIEALVACDEAVLRCDKLVNSQYKLIDKQVDALVNMQTKIDSLESKQKNEIYYRLGFFVIGAVLSGYLVRK